MPPPATSRWSRRSAPSLMRAATWLSRPQAAASRFSTPAPSRSSSCPHPSTPSCPQTLQPLTALPLAPVRGRRFATGAHFLFPRPLVPLFPRSLVPIPCFVYTERRETSLGHGCRPLRGCGGHRPRPQTPLERRCIRLFRRARRLCCLRRHGRRCRRRNCQLPRRRRDDAAAHQPRCNQSHSSMTPNTLSTAANQAIFSRAKRSQKLSGMGTTLVALLVEERHAWMLNVGDSRGYRLRNSRLEQITLDHSLVEEQVRMGRMNRVEAQRSPLRNVITRALGTQNCVTPDVFELGSEPATSSCSVPTASPASSPTHSSNRCCASICPLRNCVPGWSPQPTRPAATTTSPASWSAPTRRAPDFPIRSQRSPPGRDLAAIRAACILRRRMMCIAARIQHVPDPGPCRPGSEHDGSAVALHEFSMSKSR